MTNLSDLRAEFEAKKTAFDELLARKYPGADQWTWHRAVAAMRPDGIGRRNDDTSRDAELAADTELGVAWKAYITDLHIFYRARDGKGGFLGSRGL